MRERRERDCASRLPALLFRRPPAPPGARRTPRDPPPGVPRAPPFAPPPVVPARNSYAGPRVTVPGSNHSTRPAFSFASSSSSNASSSASSSSSRSGGGSIHAEASDLHAFASRIRNGAADSLPVAARTPPRTLPQRARRDGEFPSIDAHPFARTRRSRARLATPLQRRRRQRRAPVDVEFLGQRRARERRRRDE